MHKYLIFHKSDVCILYSSINSGKEVQMSQQRGLSLSFTHSVLRHLSFIVFGFMASF